MIKVFQQVICKDKGDCWRACIASILEMKSDDVPNFVALAEKGWGKDSHGLAKAWLRERGLVMLECRGRDPKDAFNWRMIVGAFAIASVPSQMFPKECTHAVVAQWQEHPENPDCTCLRLVHDPNPKNKPYPVDVKINGLTYILPVRPKLGTAIDAIHQDGASPYSAHKEKLPTKTAGGGTGSKSGSSHNKPASVKAGRKKV